MFRVFLLIVVVGAAVDRDTKSAFGIDPPPPGSIRVATYNMALNRKSSGQLSRDLERGDEQIRKVAAIVQMVRPDILLANEIDFDEGVSARLLNEKHLGVSAVPGVIKPLKFDHWFVAPVNTGVQSGLNLTGTGEKGKPEDAWGYGAFPGQYGMVVYSRFPIQESEVRTFQNFLWSKMPNAMRPGIGDKAAGTWTSYYPDEIWGQLRLSSKSHWDIPININGKTCHILASHPTPPVFDGPEDRNGCRNHDEIRFWKDYIEGADYMVDDLGKRGPLANDAPFVILGDLNADPVDGDGIHVGIQGLLESKRVNASFIPKSRGAEEAARLSGQANANQKGDASLDTGDFNDKNPGNLRIDYVLPSSDLKILGGAVFWPTNEESKNVAIDIGDASDHHLVWLDIQFP